MSDALTQSLRTAVQLAIAGLVAWLTARGINVSDEAVSGAQAVGSWAAGAVVVAALAWLERHFPWASRVFLVKGTPSYPGEGA